MNRRFVSYSFLALLLSPILKAEIDETIVAASLFPVSIDDSANSINVISVSYTHLTLPTTPYV